MNILLINDFKTGGGAEVIFTKTYETLIEAGNNVDLKYYYTQITPPRSALSYIFSLHNYHEIYKVLCEKKYDLVYLLNYSNAFSPSILLAIKKYKQKNSNLKVIYNAHDAHIICPNSALNYYKGNKICRFEKTPSLHKFIFKQLDHRGAIYSIIKKIQWITAYKFLRLYNIFDKILCPSQFLASRIKEVYPNLSVEILRNPLNFKDITVPQDYNKKIRTTIRLIYFGRLSTEKGLDILLHNIASIKIPYNFHIYGDGPQANQLKKIVKTLNLENQIIFKGKTSWKDLMKIISDYDIFILSSSCYENAPLSIVEAAYAGLYILTMNYGGMKEISEIVGNNFYINSSSTTLTDILNLIQKTPFQKPNCAPFSENIFRKRLLHYISPKR